MENLLTYILAKKHHQFRRDICENWAEEFRERGLLPEERMAERFVRIARMETPVILPEERICFIRTVKTLPECFTPEEWAEIKKKHFIHELGYRSNVSPDYAGVIKNGLLYYRDRADEPARRMIDALLELVERYCAEAKKQGRMDIADTLVRAPYHGATNFREALQLFRIVHFALWLEGNYHVTIGRFDQYMYPYLQADMERGLYTEETALILLEDFFLSFNKDSDLYPGVQQGDNGQSMVLGGIDRDGKEAFNLLSELCLRASRNLCLIDPKINLRVSRSTPLFVYELGSQLTKAGLGFPQYSNDDVVIDGLRRLGYDEADARDYVVAACWEFIIPKYGADVANIGAMSFPKAVDICLHRDLETCADFDAFFGTVKEEIRSQCDAICGNIKELWFVPSPFMALFLTEKYHHFGIHGTGIATAADSLAAIRKYIFMEKSIGKQALIEAVDSDFATHGDILPLLRYEAPKMGNNDDTVDSIAVELLDCFAESLRGRRNCMGGLYRAGTGSAMYYLWHADEIGASPDGRRKGEPFGTNFSPSLFARVKGPVSVMKSFSKPHFENAINGGPLTLEFQSGMFADAESVQKVAMLVKSYIDMGGHQLQLNAVNAQKLRDAQKHPEKYPQLVVRIWGWSAYFVELDKAYQDHVLARQEYTV